MCGIAGIISPDPRLTRPETLKRMADSLAHRGPDGEAYWISKAGHTGFAHRRLSIIDISAAAAQPMHYNERYTIVYNGEIYNYLELKVDLQKKGWQFRTASDTEVILAAYSHYKESCVTYFDGMFAFAIWDESEQELFCARDRFGEKPFFYFIDPENQAFYFASEMKGLHAAGIEAVQNNALLLQYLALGYTADVADASKTFDKRIKKLQASHWLKYSFRIPSPVIKKYWDLSVNVSGIELTNALETFKDLFETSVKRRLRSDVSLGASLSGGLDSSTIAATMAGFRKPSGIKTFTAVFPEFEKNEGTVARSVAEIFYFKNYTVTPTAQGLVDEFEKIIHHQEDPFTSASVYAQFKVFELAAKEKVTVLLDGQGADETLAGYDKYLSWYLRLIFPRFTSKQLVNKDRHLLNNWNLNKNFIEAHRNDIQLYKPVVTQLNDLLYFNTMQSGLEELLRYADRNSMAHGREVRLPFLNHDLVSFAFSLPSKFKIRHGFTKWLLRKLMSDKLPASVTWKKKKTGFEPPQKEWMQDNNFKEYAFEAKKELVIQGILDKKVLRKKLVAHGAYDKESAEWRFIVAGARLLKIKRGLNRNSTPFLKSNIL